MRYAFAALLTLLAYGHAAQGAETPRPGLLDARIQTVEYDPDQVVVLRGALGYQMMIEFGPDERLENVSIGDAMAWQVTPNRRANLLFLKPLDRRAVTNMTVVTSLRRYAFDLRLASGGARSPYVVRFAYPAPAPAFIDTPPPAPPGPVIANRAYSVTGSAQNIPIQVFDDGRMTYFAWDERAAVPAIFAVDKDGQESLVNYGVRDGFTVVEQIASRFVLRNGKQVATVVNQAYTTSPTVAASR